MSDDDAILRYFAGVEYVAAMKAAGPPREYASRKSPLLMLIEQAIQQNNFRQIYVRHGNLTVRLEKEKDAGDNRKADERNHPPPSSRPVNHPR